jgi:hypothetical protein
MSSSDSGACGPNKMRSILSYSPTHSVAALRICSSGIFCNGSSKIGRTTRAAGLCHSITRRQKPSPEFNMRKATSGWAYDLHTQVTCVFIHKMGGFQRCKEMTSLFLLPPIDLTLSQASFSQSDATSAIAETCCAHCYRYALFAAAAACPDGSMCLPPQNCSLNGRIA